MKKLKACIALLGLFMAAGVANGIGIANANVLETKAATSYVIDGCYGKKRPDANTLVFSAKTVIGTQGDVFTGNVFDAKGNPLPIQLKQNGGCSGQDWAGEGTRRFDFNVGDADFKAAIGTGKEFYITSESVFVKGDISVTFAKDYAFKSIWDGGYSIAEANYTSVSFEFAEAVAKPSTGKFRVSIKNMSGIAAGFAQYFHGIVKDKTGADVKTKIFDAGDGSTTAGNRKVYVLLDNDVQDNIFFIQKDSTFYSYDLTKKVTFSCFYGIQPTVLTTCDGTNHTKNEAKTLCIGCGQTFEPPVEPKTYNPVLGTTYWSQITVSTNTEVMLKVSGCTGVTGADSVYRGKATLDGDEVNLKIAISGSDIRFYVYLENESKGTAGGHLYISSDASFASDPANSFVKFTASFYLGYDTANHITKCDGVNHTMGEAIEEERGLVATCKGCGAESITPLYTATLGTSDKWAAHDGSDVNSVSIKIGGCSGITGAASVYRGNGKYMGEEHALKITVSGNIIRIYVYHTEAVAKEGTIEVNKDTMFKADGSVLSYLRFDQSFKIYYNINTYKYRVDKVDYEYVTSTISNVVKKNWISTEGSDVVLSFNNVALSNDAVVKDSITLYRGVGNVDGEDVAIRVGLQNANGGVKLVFYFPGVDGSVLKVSKDAIYSADALGTYFSEETIKLPDFVCFEEDLEFKVDIEHNLVNPVDVVFSFSGTGNWSQAIESEQYNAMASFNDCTISGIYEDKSEIHPETLKPRGYHFYGVGYDKADDTTEVPVDIWISDFKDGDPDLNMATVKTAVYVNLPQSSQSGGVKLHEDSLFICSAYNMKMTLDADYLIKWYQNSSRTTAGKYNDDQVGPTIVIDKENLPSFTEGDSVPTLPVACYDDVDDVVTNVSQTWEEGAIKDGKLVAGTWKVTITAKDAAGNEATPVEVNIVVVAKEVPQPQPEPEPKKGGCGSSLIAGSILLTLCSFAGVVIISKKHKEY